MEIISRQAAIADGRRTYFSGRPCKRGHISEMHVNEGCLQCKKDRRRPLDPNLAKARWAAYASKNRERIRTAYAEYCEKNKTKINAKSAKWRETNRDKAIAASKAWREENLGRAKEMVLAWHSENAEARRVHKQNRRAREKLGGKLSIGIIQKLYKLQKGRCACCGAALGENYHLDHIMPLALGGLNTDDNVQLLRQKCNNEKRSKHPVDFMQSRGLLL